MDRRTEKLERRGSERRTERPGSGWSPRSSGANARALASSKTSYTPEYPKQVLPLNYFRTLKNWDEDGTVPWPPGAPVWWVTGAAGLTLIVGNRRNVPGSLKASQESGTFSGTFTATKRNMCTRACFSMRLKVDAFFPANLSRMRLSARAGPADPAAKRRGLRLSSSLHLHGNVLLKPHTSSFYSVMDSYFGTISFHKTEKVICFLLFF